MSPSALFGLLFCFGLALPASARPEDPQPFAVTPAGVVVGVPGGRLRLSLPQPNVVHVEVSAGEAFSGRPSLVVVPQPAPRPWQAQLDGRRLRLSAESVAVRVDLDSGAVAFG